jgi:hypothetical protein
MASGRGCHNKRRKNTQSVTILAPLRALYYLEKRKAYFRSVLTIYSVANFCLLLFQTCFTPIKILHLPNEILIKAHKIRHTMSFVTSLLQCIYTF